jgi:hypothetical protein
MVVAIVAQGRPESCGKYSSKLQALVIVRLAEREEKKVQRRNLCNLGEADEQWQADIAFIHLKKCG